VIASIGLTPLALAIIVKEVLELVPSVRSRLMRVDIAYSNRLSGTDGRNGGKNNFCSYRFVNSVRVATG
jgi:hypothetical protein